MDESDVWAFHGMTVRRLTARLVPGPDDGTDAGQATGGAGGISVDGVKPKAVTPNAVTPKAVKPGGQPDPG